VRPATALRRRTFLAGALAAGLAACGNTGVGPTVSFDRQTLPYGPDPNQVGDLTVPLNAGPHAVVVLVHGGYWRTGIERGELAPLSETLGRLGYAVWNIDYRRVGDPGGGWPGTLTDVAAAIDFLQAVPPERKLALNRVAALGHSAGGQLALWAGARTRHPDGIGGVPVIGLRGVVGLGAVVDLVAAVDNATGAPAVELRNSVIDLLGGPPATVADHYLQASPRELAPLGIPQLLVHGGRDDRAPIETVRAYTQIAQAAGDDIRLVELPTADHFEVIRADRAGWPDVVSWLSERLG
jgi:acetyl esterase/lipase